jgi:ubiquinone/menaquinone biosynthesis C-methylase UbiE
MIAKFSKTTRKVIGRLFPNRFPGLYSTLDNQIEVPVQVAAYQLAIEKYIQPGDIILDVGIGLGYGLTQMSAKASQARGIDIDQRAVIQAQALVILNGKIKEIQVYDGVHIPYDDQTFDVVTCIDVIEHVADYFGLLLEMTRVTRRVAIVSTPNRRPEHTLPNGRPGNQWHLREWSFEEFNEILSRIPGSQVDWNFISGPLSGPFQINSDLQVDTQALTPALIRMSLPIS